MIHPILSKAVRMKMHDGSTEVVQIAVPEDVSLYTYFNALHILNREAFPYQVVYLATDEAINMLSTEAVV